MDDIVDMRLIVDGRTQKFSLGDIVKIDGRLLVIESLYRCTSSEYIAARFVQVIPMSKVEEIPDVIKAKIDGTELALTDSRIIVRFVKTINIEHINGATTSEYYAVNKGSRFIFCEFGNMKED